MRTKGIDVEKLRNYIQAKGIKQGIIARSIGVSSPHFNMMLHGKRAMSPAYYNETLRFLEITESEL